MGANRLWTWCGTWCVVSWVGCGGAGGPAAGGAAVETWHRPGFEGAVRPEMGPPQPGDAAPDFSLPTPDGRAVMLSSLRGQWVVLHFTATWCPFCDAEVEHLGKMAAAYEALGVKVVLVDVKEDRESWNAYARARVSPRVLALHDADGQAAARFAPPYAQPSFDDRSQVVLASTLLLDPSGRIRLYMLADSVRFDPTFAAVRGELERLVAEEPPSLAPDAVVRVEVTPGTPIARGGRGDVAIALRVAPGYHVMSNEPSAPNYIPTRVMLEPSDAIRAEAPRYPEPTMLRLGDDALTTFLGDVPVRLPVTIAEDAAPGVYPMRGSVRYQACTATRCLFPATRAFEFEVSVAER